MVSFQLFVVASMAIDATWFSRWTRARRADLVGALDTFAHGTRSDLLVSMEYETSLWVQTATCDSGGTTQRTTISTTAMRERQRVQDRSCPASARSPAFSRRSSSSSGALVGRQVVEDVEGCVPAAVCLGHLGPPDRRRWRFRLPPAEGLRRHPYRMNHRVRGASNRCRARVPVEWCPSRWCAAGPGDGCGVGGWGGAIRARTGSTELSGHPCQMMPPEVAAATLQEAKWMRLAREPDNP
jgi:hypothetical protein